MTDKEDSVRPLKRPRMEPHNQNGSTPPLLPPLSLSILGIEPMDEFIREVADFVHHMISTRPDSARGTVEVEAKIGLLKDKGAGHRLTLPVMTETILSPNFTDFRFESNLSLRQHRHLNNLLNTLQTSPPPTVSTPLAYNHLRVVDSFYTPDGSSGFGPNDKIRVTRDESTGTVTECMRKIRLGDLNVYCPRRVADWRVSVNLEVPVQHPLGSPTHTRRKDRMSYEHEEFKIDLTQVTSSAGGNIKDITHELEVEFARPAVLMSTAANRGNPRATEHERNAFDELIRAFVNNARTLVRNVAGE